MTVPRGRVLVVGAGVVGLTAAVRLVEDGWDVEVLTADDPLATTSSVAAAIWYPYRADPRDRVLAWGAASMRALTALAAEPGAGVRLLPCRELLAAPAADPWWRSAVPAFGRVTGPLPAGAAAAWEVTVPVVAMPVHLRWLLGRLAAAGVPVTRRRVTDLDALGGAADLVVHCAGLGARDLAGDASLTPVRGQVVVVENPGLERAWLDQRDRSHPTYVVPRGVDCVLGGTAVEGAEAGPPDPAVAADVLARCAVLEPRLAGARVLAHRVGARPVRPTVRLELEERPSGPVIHDYGHGGAGVTLSWGCAEEVVALARDVAGAAPATP